MDGPPVLLGGKLAQFLEKHMGVQPDDKYSEKALGVSGLEVTTSEDCFFPLALEPGWPISTVFVFSHSNSFYQSQRGSLNYGLYIDLGSNSKLMGSVAFNS